MIDRRNETFKALAKELLDIQQGSVEDATALLEEGSWALTDEEFEQVRIYIEEMGLSNNDRLMISMDT